jgi:hypothetical protein
MQTPPKGGVAEESSGGSGTALTSTPHAPAQASTVLSRSEPRDGVGLSTIGETSSAAVNAVPARVSERDDAYPAIAQLSAQWRVIRCRDDMQWILQKRQGGLWRGNSYHRDQDVLLERIVSRCGEVDAAALDVIRELIGSIISLTGAEWRRLIGRVRP